MDPCEVLPKRRKIAFEKGETSSSAISPSKNDYQVFLSFRGPDTRQGFTNCLYHTLIDSGIIVFKDDEELPLGDKIDEIFTAIDNSKICIVVLSSTFAESKWCLEEVERMVDKKKDIVPIFYDVTPNDVKLKTELYAGYLMGHEANYGIETAQKWREALKEIPKLHGRELKNTGYIEFCRQIAKKILRKLNVYRKLEIDNFVDVPDEVEAALKLLDTGSGGCRFLAIHGMGGIGKTTLAKSIFNQISDNFDCSCFLENIRENLSQLGGLRKLQEQLLRSIDPSMRDAAYYIVDAIGKIKNNFTRKKVLIVLDDIDHKNHIYDLVGSFGSGSRIIFTTRNTELHDQGTSSNAHFYGLEKKEMDSKQALKLFSRHAFGKDSPPEDFESLSAEAISTTGGLPLALELVGSLLQRPDANFWIEKIKKLKEVPHKDVQRRLKISYDALDDEQQEIFLDIACFFIGKETSNAVYMWEACEFDPNDGIEVLVSMSLIKLKEKKRFWMHDQLRDLGRAIVKVNSKDARSGSRLWMHKDALDQLKTNVGKEKVEALHLDGPSGYLDCGNFVGLEKLRYLRLTECANFGGDFRGLIPKLRWLSLSLIVASSFNVTNLCLRELVILKLSSIGFDETWQGWCQILISKQLKVLTLSNCNELISTPDLSNIVNLERLVLKNCGNLTSIHSSVGKLHCLRHLRIKNCVHLHELPEELTSLEGLEQLSVSSFLYSSLERCDVPMSIGRLVSLTRLRLRCTSDLLDGIGELVKLTHLSLVDSSISVLPDSIGDLRLLISLDLRGSTITRLPTTIGQLANLESLCLASCRSLYNLPESIGNLHSLIDLDLTCSPISELPHSFGNLASLQKLKLSGSEVRSLPDSFRGLESLEMLKIGNRWSWITELQELPSGLISLDVTNVQKIQNLPNLTKLSHLQIRNSEAQQLVVVFEGIEKLIELKQLSIECSIVKSLFMEWGALQQLKSLVLCCSKLEFQQCQLPCNLETLDLDVKRWGQLPINLSSLKNLSKLKLSNFVIEQAYSVEGLESLEVLEMTKCILKFSDFPVLTRLRELHLEECCSHIGASPPLDHDLEEELEFQIKLSNLKNLSELSLIAFYVEGSHNLERSKKQIELSNLKNLSKLLLKGFPIHEDRFKVEGGLESLVVLEMEECIIYEFGNVSVLKSLTSLSILKCEFPTTTCLHIPPLDRLVKLHIGLCRDLVDIQGIGKLKSLKKLCLGDCYSLQRIGDLSKLNKLAILRIFYCRAFEGIDGGVERLLSAGTLSHLIIRDCNCKDELYGSSDAEEGYGEY